LSFRSTWRGHDAMSRSRQRSEQPAMDHENTNEFEGDAAGPLIQRSQSVHGLRARLERLRDKGAAVAETEDSRAPYSSGSAWSWASPSSRVESRDRRPIPFTRRRRRRTVLPDA
jgi:hypothetical protein